MDGQLKEIYADAFLRFTERMFAATRSLPFADDFLKTQCMEVPFIGGRFFVGVGDDDSELAQRVASGLLWREIFRRDAPTWAVQPLPLTQEACDALADDDNPRRSLVGLFGVSLRGEDWSQKHPCFASFCRGLLAYEHCPKHLLALRHEFPPRPLEGFADGWLSWRSPETLALHQRIEMLTAAMDARSRPPSGNGERRLRTHVPDISVWLFRPGAR